MSLEVKIPVVGESVATGMISAWLKHDGDLVQKGEPLFVLDTDKVVVEVTADGEGTLRINAQVGAEVKIGEVVAVIEKGAATPAPKPLRELPKPMPPTSPSAERVGKVEQKATVKPAQVPQASTQFPTRALPTEATTKVFISYRREGGGPTARLIQSELRHRGYSTFLDVDALRSGHFDKALFREIENADALVLILSRESLTKLSTDNDWLGREVAHALKLRKRIVPILLPGFVFPETALLPPELQTLSMHNSIPYSHDFFDAMIDKLDRYLRSS